MTKARDLANSADVFDTVTATELSYLDGVTSAIQTQLNSKAIPADVVNNTLVDAKGDLITATADNVPARLAVGNNGETLVADSAASTGLRWQGSYAAGRNFLINGGMDIWQRSTSNATTGYQTADRWYNVVGGTTTFSRDTSVPANSNLQYSHKWTTGASSSFGQFYQALEADTVRPLRGQTMVFSFWVRHTGTAFTGVLNADVAYSNASDAYVSQTTGVTISGGTNITPTGTWTKYSTTFTMPSDAVGIKVGLVPTQVQASGVVVFFTGAQLEIGSVATSFTRAGGTLQGELAACQRYYWRWNAATQFATLGTGAALSSTVACITAYHPVPMRTIVSAIDGSANNTFRLQDQVTGFTQTAASIEVTQQDVLKTELNVTVASGLTQYRFLRYGANNSTSTYLGFSAEL